MGADRNYKRCFSSPLPACIGRLGLAGARPASGTAGSSGAEIPATVQRRSHTRVKPLDQGMFADGTAPIVMSPLEFAQRLAALIPRPRLHLIRFGARKTSLCEVSGARLPDHRVLAPNAKPRALVVSPGPEADASVSEHAASGPVCTHCRCHLTGRDVGCAFTTTASLVDDVIAALAAARGET